RCERWDDQGQSENEEACEAHKLLHGYHSVRRSMRNRHNPLMLMYLPAFRGTRKKVVPTSEQVSAAPAGASEARAAVSSWFAFAGRPQARRASEGSPSGAARALAGALCSCAERP